MSAADGSHNGLAGGRIRRSSLIGRKSDDREGNTAIIRALAEADLPEAQRIVRVAFGTFLGAPDPERFWSDLDYVYGRFEAEHRCLRRGKR